MPGSPAIRRARLEALKPEQGSELESQLAWQIAMDTDIPLPVREHRFAPPRRWRLDFSWPSIAGRQLAVEVDGATWTNGRHNRGAGFAADTEKLNAAALAGYCVLRFTSQDIKNGTALTAIREAFGLATGSVA